jgi:hypothetical protein
MSICCTGASLPVLVMELSILVVILEGTAKNACRLKHCIEVCDTTHHCLSCSYNTVQFFFFMLKEGHQSSQIVLGTSILCP